MLSMIFLVTVDSDWAFLGSDWIPGGPVEKTIGYKKF